MTEPEGLVIGVLDTSRQEGSSTSRPTDDTYLLADERGKDVAEEGYKMGSVVDAGELKMVVERFIQLEVMLEGSMRTIAIPMDHDLLKIMEYVVPTLVLL